MSANPEASNKARAISRGADLIAAYASDGRGWAYGPMTGAGFLDSAGSDVEHEAPSIIGDAIADILHAAEYVGLDTDDVIARALNHYHGERSGDLDTAWRDVPASDVEYVPAIASTAYEPVMVVFRHPDHATETTEHYLDVRVVDIDLGASFDITIICPDDLDTIAEYADALRGEVADLPADHTARIEVEQIIADYLDDAIEEAERA